MNGIAIELFIHNANGHNAILT